MEDYIITPNGRLVGRLDHIFKDTINVEEAQIVQNKVEKIIIRMRVNAKFSKSDELQVIRKAKLRLGNDIKIIFEFVDNIERTSNGKFKFILSNLDKHKFMLNGTL